jgi:muramoyltetrapeptide carboxypeptidase
VSAPPISQRRKPRALPAGGGGRIAVVAPASPPQMRSGIEQATEYFSSRGHEVVLGPNHRKVHGYLAGTDTERAADLQWALTEPGIDMVHALEGGYGTARLYPLIDWDAVGRAEPRIVCGFSDLTALHLFIATHTDWVSFYGPSFLRFTRTKGDYSLTKETEEFFHRAVSGPEPVGRIFEDPEEPYVLTLGEGTAEAPLAGGCLTLLCSSIGTPYEVQTEGRILIVEDLNTEPYLVDTALNHLRLAGKLDGIAGFAFGTSVNLQYQTLPEGPESTLSIEEILDELIAPLGVPAISNVPFGHGKHMATMPLGARARLDASGKYLEVLETGVEPSPAEQAEQSADTQGASA